MGTVKGFWQHVKGKVYAVESTAFGKIIGAVGPLEADNLLGLEDYEYKKGIIDWVEEALSEGKLRRYRPEVEQQQHNKKALLRIKWIRRFISRNAF